MKKAINVLTDFVLVILLLLAILLAPFLFGFTFCTPISGSMKPTLGIGELIVLKKVKFEEIKVGDVIGFKLEGMDILVLHRVVEVIEEKETKERIGLLTKGDANKEPDPWIVTSQNLKGKMVFHLPYLGYVASVRRNKIGFVSLVVVLFFIIIALLFWPKKTKGG